MKRTTVSTTEAEQQRAVLLPRTIAALLLGAASMMVPIKPASAQALTPSCPASLVPGGHDYHGLPLTMCNFSGLDLTNANFNGAKLKAVVFIRTILTGADFSGATIEDSGSPAFTTDFSFATLTNAKFVGTLFNAPAYFTYATLGCTDFSNTVLNNGNAIFGDAKLKLGSDASCRTAFRGSTMNCEFVAQWDRLDLSGAIIDACVAQLQTVAGRMPYDFSNGIYSGVVFDGLDLSGTKWSGAVLEGASFQRATLDKATGLSGTPSVPSRLSGAKFSNASVQNVDLSNAQLYGAKFDNANLSNSSFAGSFLTANNTGDPPIKTAASFDGAHLKNVTFANAKLAGATFNFASLYGTFGGGTPSFPCAAANSQCKIPTGFTCGCATVSGADLTGTDFGNAYLYGVDFTGAATTVNGTKFGSAILVGSSFENASFQVNGGAAPDFTKAMLQGAVFSGTANIGGSSLLNAFPDFGAATNPSIGNVLFLLLSADYTGFSGWRGAAQPCVQAAYGVFTALPSQVSLTCPNGSSAVCGAGTPAPNANPNWAGKIALANNKPVPGGYLADATYDQAQTAAPGTCNGQPVDPNW